MHVMSERFEPTPEREIDPRSIAIVTGAYYPTWGTEKESTVDNIRGNLSVEMMQDAKKKGCRGI